MRLLLFLLLITGCVTTYKPVGSGGPYGGYASEQIGNGKHLVSYRGNNMDARSTVRSFAFRRVREVCKSDDYDIITTQDRPMAGGAYMFEVTVQCKESNNETANH